jgi:osmotically-inducible protein OsmY
VVEVDNQLVDDSTLRLQVAYALANDARTRHIPPGYKVVSQVGRVVVVGNFTDEASRAAVVSVCQSVPGVRSARVKSI